MKDYTENIINRWQDGINVLLGLWLIVSPWALGFFETSVATWNVWAVGAIVCVAALAALIEFHEWEEWVNAALGLWLIASPWLFGLTEMPVVMWNLIVTGILVAGLAVWSYIAGMGDETSSQKS